MSRETDTSEVKQHVDPQGNELLDLFTLHLLQIALSADRRIEPNSNEVVNHVFARIRGTENTASIKAPPSSEETEASLLTRPIGVLDIQWS